MNIVNAQSSFIVETAYEHSQISDKTNIYSQATEEIYEPDTLATLIAVLEQSPQARTKESQELAISLLQRIKLLKGLALSTIQRREVNQQLAQHLQYKKYSRGSLILE